MQYVKEYYDIPETKRKENASLQLLNKNNNWATFFIKAIIQDSAKKGYEKVLFPKGDTASKVEGHTTLEEFKKQKEDRIKFLDGEINDPENIERRIEAAKQEKEQIRQELERVEGPEGFAALRPIYNFYENIVTNILLKQFGKDNVRQITDEYGNTWNEVVISSERDLQPVYFQTKNIFSAIDEIEKKLKPLNKTINSMGSEKNINNVLKKAGLEPELREQFIQLVNDNPSLKELKVSTVLSTYLREFVKDSDKAYYKAIDEPLSKGLEKTLIEYFDRFRIKRKELDNLKEKFGVDSIGVFDVLAKTVYYSKNRNLLTLPEEYGHVFVELLGSIGNKKADNPLFKYLFDKIESWDGYQRVFRDYRDKYVTAEGNIDIYKIKKEAIGQAIGIALVRNYKNNEAANRSVWDQIFGKDISFWTKIQQVIDYICSLLKGIDYVNINLEVDKIAKDILSKNYSKLDRLKKDTSNYNLLSYSETIKTQNKKDNGLALSFMKWYSDLGNIITGSLAYRLQGTTYRPEIDALHDIDMIVPSDVHKVNLDKSIYLSEEELEKDAMYRKLISEGNFREAKKYKIQGNLKLDLDGMLQNEYFKKIKEKYPDLDFLYTFYNQKANAYYITINAIWSKDQSLKDKFKSYTGSFNSRLENFTPEELDKIYLFDFFLRPETSDEYKKVEDKEYGLNLAHFNYAFYEKLNMMGRAKDAYDYQMWDYFDENNILAPDFNDRLVYFQIQNSKNELKEPIKKGAVEVFNDNPRLSTIGTQEQYFEYLNTIFPDSKVKDIVYHTNTRGRIESFNSERGLFVTPTLELAKAYKPGRNGKRFQLLINSKNINEVSEETIMDGKKQSGDTLMYSEPDYTEYVVFEPEQIHILGSVQDIEMFENFVANQQAMKERVNEKPIKEGVDKIFEQTPELVLIGTAQDYSDYLDNVIFPERSLKEIVYHSTVRPFETFDNTKTTQLSKDLGEGIYFSDLEHAPGWAAYQEESVGRVRIEQEGLIKRTPIEAVTFFKEWLRDLPLKDKEKVKKILNTLSEDPEMDIDPYAKYKAAYNEFTGKDLDNKGLSQNIPDVLDKAKVIPMIINAKNIFYTPDGFISTQYKEYDETTVDTVIEYDEDDKNKIVQGVFRNTDEIHMLGGQEDLQKFQEYMDFKNNVKDYFNLNEEDTKFVKDISNLNLNC